MHYDLQFKKYWIFYFYYISTRNFELYLDIICDIVTLLLYKYNAKFKIIVGTTVHAAGISKTTHTNFKTEVDEIVTTSKLQP